MWYYSNSGDWKFVTSIVPITNAFNETTLVEDLKLMLLNQIYQLPLSKRHMELKLPFILNI